MSGEGTVERRGGWVFLRVSLPGGKRPRVKLGPSTMTDAEIDAAVLSVRRELASGHYVVADKVEAVTCDWWAETWFRAREKKLASVKDDRQRWSKWCRSIHQIDVRALSRADVEGVVRELDAAVEAEEIAWKTARNVWGVLSKMCRDMARSKVPELRVRDDNPADGVEPPDAGDDDAMVYLYPKELSQLLASPKVDPVWRALYAIAAYTGLRRGEIDALRWGDVEGTVIRVARATGQGGAEKRTKTGTSRTVPIEPTLQPLLDVLRAGPSERVCRAPLWQAPQFRAHLEAAGVVRPALFARGPGQRPIRFHDLRATCATWQAIRGDDALKIQFRMGHTGPATTMRYIREAETLGDVGTPFPEIPITLVSELSQALSQGQEEARKRARKPMILATPTGLEGVGPLADSGTSEGRGTRSGPGLARCGAHTGELAAYGWLERVLAAGDDE